MHAGGDHRHTTPEMSSARSLTTHTCGSSPRAPWPRPATLQPRSPGTSSRTRPPQTRSPPRSTTGIDDPNTGLALAVRCGAQGDQLAAVTEAYGLSPAETATALTDHRCPDHVLLDTLDARCDGDAETVVALAGSAGLSADAIDAWINPVEPITPPIARWGALDLGDAAELLAMLPDPQPAGSAIDLADSLDLEPTHLLEPSHP